MVREGKLVERPKNYTIDAEIGQLEVDIFDVIKNSERIFSGRRDIFPEIGSREHFKTPCFRELVVFFPCDETFRKSTEKINRFLWRGEREAIQYRTVANIVEREGSAIQEHICKKSEALLKEHGFSADGQIFDENKVINSKNDENIGISEEAIIEAINELNQGKEEELQIDLSELHETFENHGCIQANISLDDVCSKKQKALGRKKGASPKTKREMVNNTIAHIQNGEFQTYTLNTSNISQMMIVVLAFLLKNGLLSRSGPLVFFLDGAADLRVAIEHFFSFHTFKMLLDWYHIEKKCKERLSMAMKGKEVRNKALERLLAFLWHGKVELAIQYLRCLNKDDLKNQQEIERLIGYFERNRSFMPCYALRKKLGLRVSSNQVEKANDLIVSSRQKNNGMSWSSSGSLSLATVTCVRQNSEQENWLLHRDIKFQFATDSEKAAA